MCRIYSDGSEFNTPIIEDQGINDVYKKGDKYVTKNGRLLTIDYATSWVIHWTNGKYSYNCDVMHMLKIVKED